jgi:hydrogenase nickel incorporation protein HypA/HybF
MHEMSLAASIREMSRQAVAGKGPGRIESVRVAIGELSAVEPDLLAYAWDALTRGTRDVGARLVIDWRPALQICSHCGEGKVRSPGSWLRLCPDCGEPVRIEGGTDLDLIEVCFDATD